MQLINLGSIIIATIVFHKTFMVLMKPVLSLSGRLKILLVMFSGWTKQAGKSDEGLLSVGQLSQCDALIQSLRIEQADRRLR